MGIIQRAVDENPLGRASTDVQISHGTEKFTRDVSDENSEPSCLQPWMVRVCSLIILSLYAPSTLYTSAATMCILIDGCKYGVKAVTLSFTT